MAKTNEEIQKLKENWNHDPCWDIETEPGFEDHFEELKKFREETELNWQVAEKERIENRIRVIEIETGVIALGAALNIETYKEISSLASRADKEGDRVGVEAAHVSATLLLAAQVQRIADLIQAQMEDIELNRESDALTEVWKIK